MRLDKELYREWLDHCLDQFPDREYHQENVPENYDPAKLIEFAEDGDAYPHGIGGTGHIKRAVISFDEFCN